MNLLNGARSIGACQRLVPTKWRKARNAGRLRSAIEHFSRFSMDQELAVDSRSGLYEKHQNVVDRFQFRSDPELKQSMEGVMSRRSVLIALAVIAVVIAAWWLIGGGGGAQPKELRVALFQAPASETLRDLTSEFEQETGARVTVEILGYADLQTRIEQQALQRGGGAYDVIMVDSILIPGYARNGVIEPIGDALTSDANYQAGDLIPALADYLGKYPANGETYGVPFMSNTHMMAYRPSEVEPVMRRLGLSLPGTTQETAWTWQQYSQVAAAISSQRRQRRANAPYGTSLQARSGAWLVYEWYSVLYGFVQNPETRRTGVPDFNQAGVRAADFYASLYRQAPPEALSWGHEEETAAMCSGQTAMDATSNVELAAGLVRPECAQGGSGIRFAFPPRGLSGTSSPDMGGYGLFVARRSGNRDLAIRFLRWASSRSVHRRVVLGGGSPIRSSELADPEVLRRYPYLQFYGQLIATSIYRARTPNWVEMQDVISRELGEVLLGRKSSAQAMEAIQTWVNQHPSS